MNTLKHYAIWLNVPIEEATNKHVLLYIDSLLEKRLKPKSINCHLDSIRGFYEYLAREEGIDIPNPVKRGYVLRLPRPLPRYVRDEDLEKFFKVIKGPRDKAMFILMLRCGLRVEEVENLNTRAVNLKQRKILVQSGKGGKDRVVYISDDAYIALIHYLRVRSPGYSKKVFLVEKGIYKGKPISVRGIQKRMEYYAREARLRISCHHLRHTMATQLLNADADLVSIQDLLGHSRIKTTQRYCKLSNRKVQRDYYKAMATVLQRSMNGIKKT